MHTQPTPSPAALALALFLSLALSLSLLACQSAPPSDALVSPRKGQPAQGKSSDCERYPEDQIAFAYRVPPRYPPTVTGGSPHVGFVELRFDVDQEGRPIHVEITKSSLGRRFDRSALSAFRKWRLCPREFGKQGQIIRIAFEPGVSPGSSVPDTGFRGLQ